MKEAAAASILSTRWKHIWHSIPKLNFNDDSYSSVNFTSLVNRVLLQHKGSCLNEFCLNCEKSCDPLDVNAWINAALLCNVQRLNISVSLKYQFSLSRELFFNTKLVVLTLKASFVMNVPSSVCLPCLKAADLSMIHFLDDGSFTRFICCCPVLEELTLFRCIGEDMHTINIVSPTLTRLVLGDMPFDGTEGHASTIKYKVAIDSPSLMYLQIDNYFAEGYLMKGLRNLIEARVEIHSDLDIFSPTDYEAISNLLKGVSDVQSFHLSWFDLPGLKSGEHFKMPKFPKLSYLELIVGMPCEFLGEMLDISPSLETLVYKEEDDPFLGIDWETAPRNFHCHEPLTSLKVIEIEIVFTFESIDHIVKFFLKNANALEKLCVQTKHDCGELKYWLKSVGYFKSRGKVTKKLAMEFDEDEDLRRWIVDYTR